MPKAYWVGAQMTVKDPEKLKATHIFWKCILIELFSVTN